MSHQITTAPDQFFLYAINLFLRHKLNYLSTRLVHDKERLVKLTEPLNDQSRLLSIAELDGTIKGLRATGVGGIHNYFLPLQKLYIAIKNSKLQDFRQIDSLFVADFLTTSTDKLSDATKRNYRVVISNFFQFLDKNYRRLNSNHMFGFDLRRWGGSLAEQKLPSFLSENELSLFLSEVHKYPFQKSLQNRNKLLLTILTYTGMRIGEALALRFKDISMQEDSFLFVIKGKGGKYRTAVVEVKRIEEYLAGLSNKSPDEYVFANKSGGQIKQAYASRLVRLVLQKIGIRKEKNGAHLLRHSFASLVYKKKKDILLVQEALGHTSLETSRIYTHLDTDSHKKIIEVFAEF